MSAGFGLDQPGGLWMKNALVGKFGSEFCSTASQHGGQETTITSFHTTLRHHGMLIIGLPYSFTELSSMQEIQGGCRVSFEMALFSRFGTEDRR